MEEYMGDKTKLKKSSLQRILVSSLVKRKSGWRRRGIEKGRNGGVAEREKKKKGVVVVGGVNYDTCGKTVR